MVAEMWQFLIVALCCTLIHSRFLDEDMLLFWKRANTKSCKPFTTYTVQCNRCVCGADATEFCTRMACPVKKESAPSDDSDAYTDHN